MGKMIQFAATGRYKIILIVCICMAALFLMLGIILSVTMGTTYASAISVRASGSTQVGTRYIVPVYALPTPININTNPSGATVTLTIIKGHGLVSIPESIRGGQELIITPLNNDKGVPTFYNQADPTTHIEITASSGTAQTIYLEVRISLLQSQGVVTTRLERRTSQFAPWVPATQVSFVDYLTYQNSSNPIYRIVSTFSIMGKEIYSTQTLTHLTHFNETELIAAGIGGAGPELFRRMNLNQGTYLFLPSNTYWVGDHQFAINVEFQGQTFTDFFTLKVVLRE